MTASVYQFLDFRTAGAYMLNIFSATSLIVFNKQAMDIYSFQYATTLTGFHLICTYVLLLLLVFARCFKFKKLPFVEVSKLAAGTMGFITLTNLSLQHNSIGFYQVMKIMTTPTVVLIESLLYQNYISTSLKLTIFPICLGVLITTVSDFRLNIVGLFYAIAAVIVSSLYQIWCGQLQKSLHCNALQLQLYVAPLAFCYLLPFVPLLDNWFPWDPSSIWNYKFDIENVVAILITGVFGFLVNVSIFLVIGRSSALSYNILGHCKTIFIVLSDFLIFGRRVDFASTFGIGLTLLGVFAYSFIKLNVDQPGKQIKQPVTKVTTSTT